MELATPHHPDRARRLTRPARLIGAHLQLGGKIEKSSLWPRWSSLPAVRRDDSCLERNRAPRGPQRMLTLFTGVSLDKSPGDSLLFKQSALRGVCYALTLQVFQLQFHLFEKPRRAF